MLNLLRKINFPESVRSYAPVIPARFLRHAADYESLIEIAERDAQSILDQAHAEAQQIRENARKEAIESVKADVSSLSDLSKSRFDHLLHSTTQLVVDVVTLSVERLIGELSDTQKLQKLVALLVSDGLNSRELKIECSPDQAEAIEKELAAGLSKTLAIHTYEVIESADLNNYELRLTSPGGAERKVSLHNIIGLFGTEIKKMESEIHEFFIEATANEQD